MPSPDTNEPATPPETLALSALAWVLSDGDRAERLLGTTGLSPEELRAGIGDPHMLAAILTFLEAHEPDLVSCAEALDVSPDKLVAARTRLETRAS